MFSLMDAPKPEYRFDSMRVVSENGYIVLRDAGMEKKLPDTPENRVKLIYIMLGIDAD